MAPRKFLLLILILAVFFGSVYAAVQVGSNYGTIDVSDVKIQATGYSISGTLYVPSHINGKASAFALAHGVSNAKETLGGLALELAKNGFVVLTIDEKGHGESDSGVGVTDPTLGLSSAVDYLASLPYVEANRIGVAGHSMGAGAVRATLSQNPTIAAAVLIGGGQGDSNYKPMNASFPRNLLFVVGRNDVLFNITSLDAYLRPVFNTTGAIAPGTTYGDFADGTARRLILLGTIHLLEPVDPTTISEVILWARYTLNPEIPVQLVIAGEQTYLLREALMAIALLAFTASIVPLSQILYSTIPGTVGAAITVRERFLRERRALLFWGLLGLLLYLPGMLLGALLPFPPLIFGASMAWWLLTTGVVGYAIMGYFAWRSKGSINPLGYLRESFGLRDAILGALLFLLLYAMGYAATQLGEKLRLLVPLFVPLTQSRAAVFPLFLPFCLIYFAVEGLYLHIYRTRQGAGSAAGNMARALLIKLGPYIALLVIQYLPMFAANTRILSGQLGFFIEFIWAIVPLMALSTFSSWWLYRLTGRIWVGIILNALLYSWVCAGLFPFTAFR